MPSLHITTSKPNHPIPKHHIHLPDFNRWVQEFEMHWITSNEIINRFSNAVVESLGRYKPEEIVVDTAFYGYGLTAYLEKWLVAPVRWSAPMPLTINYPEDISYIDQLLEDIEHPASTLSSIAIVPAYLPGKGPGYGLQQVFERRLSGRLDPCILLSFQTAEQLSAHDTYSMLLQPEVHVVRLPVVQSDLQKALLEISQHQISGSEIKEAMKQPALQLAQGILASWRHGRENDLVNSVFVPLRLALLQGNENIFLQYKMRFFDLYNSREFGWLAGASHFLRASEDGEALYDFVKACRKISIYDIERNREQQYIAVQQAIETFQNLSQHV
jgi:hypothetical protein